MSTRQARRQVHKAASYTINPSVDQAGTVFTNRSATGSITFTLPTPNRAQIGSFYDFRALAAQALVVAGAAVDTLVALSDVAADSVSVPTIGGAMRAECHETSSGVFQWVVFGTAVGHTYTVAT